MNDALSLRLDKEYVDFLNAVKQQLKDAQLRATLAANRELISFYWRLGSDLIEKQQSLENPFLDQFSSALAYPDFENGAQPVRRGHIVVLLHKMATMEIF